MSSDDYFTNKDKQFNMHNSEESDVSPFNSAIPRIDSESEDEEGDGIHRKMNENVFEANETNILKDALYVYDYINMVMGIE